MIIRHDLKVVFLHVPKCAGKEIRNIFKIGSNNIDIEEFFNFEYDTKTHKYVDLAHLSTQNLRLRKIFKYIKKYKTVSCARNPYARLRSAVNEYYRQKSKRTERLVINNKVNQNAHNT